MFVYVCVCECMCIYVCVYGKFLMCVLDDDRGHTQMDEGGNPASPRQASNPPVDSNMCFKLRQRLRLMRG